MTFGVDSGFPQALNDYARWHLGLTEGANDETKARYAFVFGDFRPVHRSGLIACVYRPAEWRHKTVELAAHHLLQHLDRTSATESHPPDTKSRVCASTGLAYRWEDDAVRAPSLG